MTRSAGPPRRQGDVPGRAVEAGYGTIATEIRAAGEFYFAEDYHQQYLYKDPNGYCPVHATGVKLEGPIVTMEQV